MNQGALPLLRTGELGYNAAMNHAVFHGDITVRIRANERFFGPGIAQLMETVEQCGSLRQATLMMDMSYSKAWRIVRNAEENLGFKLFETNKGGFERGGAVLTEEGKRFLNSYRSYQKAVEEFAEDAFMDYFG